MTEPGDEHRGRDVTPDRPVAQRRRPPLDVSGAAPDLQERPDAREPARQLGQKRLLEAVLAASVSYQGSNGTVISRSGSGLDGIGRLVVASSGVVGVPGAPAPTRAGRVRPIEDPTVAVVTG